MTTGDDPYPIRPVSSEEFDAFHTVDMHAFHGSPLSEDDRQVVTSRLEFDRSLAAFDGATPVGTAAAYSFQLTVPGLQSVPAAGVTWVSVLPSHRRRGVLSSLMRRQLADVRDHGEPVAVLYGMEWAGKVSAYQTGRRTDVPANLRPGAVVLALAIRRAIEAGRREFDLQADEVPYKMQFASQSRPLVQVRAARATLVEGLRRAARWCVRRLRSVTSKSSPQA